MILELSDLDKSSKNKKIMKLFNVFAVATFAQDGTFQQNTSNNQLVAENTTELVASDELGMIQHDKILNDNPLDRLNQLVRFSDQLFDDWFCFLKSKKNWKAKFDRNALRMEEAYGR